MPWNCLTGEYVPQTSFSTFELLSTVAGGVGLFLLGMHLLTDGLKLAAGRALAGLLEQWTSTPLRGLGAGMLITTLVQSSSAVTVASIGFVNAGLLTLRHALWVIFGSNVGTTMNAWLVAALGFNFKIDAFALPFIGLGAALMLAGRGLRAKALGQALAGFGVLFLGIDVLKEGFSNFGTDMGMDQFIAPGLYGYLLLVALGTVLTVLMQASGAAIAIVITAAQGGVLSVAAACAMVIGTNIGTTSTAVLSAMGATANARRLAAAHVFFNLVTGAVALALLPVMIGVLSLVQEWLAQPATPAVMVALFHTTFNILGVLLMVPTSAWLLGWLERHFRSGEEDRARPHYLDSAGSSVPDLALRALRLELGRTQAMACGALASALAVPPDGRGVEHHKGMLTGVAGAIGDYAQKVSAARLPMPLVEQLAVCLRVLRYQESAVEAALGSALLASGLPGGGALPGASMPAERARLFHDVTRRLAAACDPAGENFSSLQVDQLLQEAEAEYERLKEALLVAGADAELSIALMQEHLRQASQLRRGAQQLAKAARHLADLERGIAPPEENHEILDTV